MTAIPAAAFTLSSPVKAEAPGRTALAGYDPVSYFTTGHPEQGSPQFSAAFDGANYHFASEAHRKMFAAHPGRYAPLYRGYCATGVANGLKVEGDPGQWMIRNGKLIVFGNQQAKAVFEANPVETANKANAMWATLKSN